MITLLLFLNKIKFTEFYSFLLYRISINFDLPSWFITRIYVRFKKIIILIGNFHRIWSNWEIDRYSLITLECQLIRWYWPIGCTSQALQSSFYSIRKIAALQLETKSQLYGFGRQKDYFLCTKQTRKQELSLRLLLVHCSPNSRTTYYNVSICICITLWRPE